MDVRDGLTGRLINERFRIVAPLSRDASGRLYRAEQLSLGRPVALKVLDPRQKAQGEEARAQFQQRFLLEASIASRLQHPNTVAVFDYGCTEDGLCFMAFELVEGRTLATAFREDGPFEEERVVHVALQVARSLREAHRLGVVHGDLKPLSIVLTRHGDEEDFVRVGDFGLSRNSPSDDLEDPSSGLFLGAPKYMSPERIRGDRVDSRSDVYSLGVCMYEMLTGRVPFDRPNAVQILMAHMQERVAPIERPDCQPALLDLVMSCLAKNPDDRPASMDDVILLLKRSLGRLSMPTGMLMSREISLTTLNGTLSGFSVPPFDSQAVPAQGTGSQVVSPAPTMPPSPRGGRYLKGAVIVLGVAVAVFLAFRVQVPKHQDTIAAAAVAPSQAAGVAAVPAPEADALPEAPTTTMAVIQADRGVLDHPHVRVRFSSSPSGAFVNVGEKRYGPTPADVELWGEHVAAGKEISFVFEKDGYESVTITRLVRPEGLNLDVTMQRGSGSRRGGGERSGGANALAESSREADPTPLGRLEQWPASAAATSAVVPAAVAPAAVAPAPQPAAVAASQPAPTATAAPAASAPAPAAQPASAKKAVKPASVIASYSTPLREANTAYPEYPRSALRAGISGIVVARVYVRADGRVGAVDVLEGPAVFHEEVRKALMTWRYNAARLADGTAVPDTHIVRVPFQMK